MEVVVVPVVVLAGSVLRVVLALCGLLWPRGCFLLRGGGGRGEGVLEMSNIESRDLVLACVVFWS